jgi:predicted nuclease of restriction endonuclease-like RecB superfamily
MERFNAKVVIETGFQKKLFLEIKEREKLSQRKLAKLLKVSRSGVKNWAGEKRKIPQFIFEILLKKFPWTSEYKNYVHGILPSNWVQIKGGKIRSKMKNNLTREDRIRGFKRAKLCIGRRKVRGPNGEIMFNDGEKKIAEELARNNIKYIYEPIILLGKNYAIPDFVVNDVIVERCGYGDWKPYWSNLKRKIRRLEKHKKYRIVILVPSNNFDMVIKKLNNNTKNVIILKEENLEQLLDFLSSSKNVFIN